MGKGDKKSKRGKIIMGSFGVRRPSRKRKAIVPVVKKAEEKPKKAPKVVEEPVEVPVVSVEQPKVEEKKPVKKAPAKKAAEGETEKPKAAKTKKKAAAEGETLFDQKQEPTPEK
jgi:30S ribosomal protein S31